jgi:hypothetical protein
MNIEELGRRAVACKHWRWMRGMLASNGEEDVRIFYVSANHLHLIEFEDDEFGMVRIPKDTCLIPDLSDPATLGCLVALIEEAWKCPIDMSFAGACRLDVDAEERVYPQDHTASFAAKTRVEALVLALEGAP